MVSLPKRMKRHTVASLWSEQTQLDSCMVTSAHALLGLAPLLPFHFFKGYLLHSVDKHMSKASNSADQIPAPLKSNIGEDGITTFGKGDERRYPKQ